VPSKHHVQPTIYVTSEFVSRVNGLFALLGYYAALFGSQLPTFQESLLVPSSRVKQSSVTDVSGPNNVQSSRVKQSSCTALLLNMAPISCPETSVTNY
jgi:hypothetical protein